MKFQSRGVLKDFTDDEMLEIKDLLQEDDFDIDSKLTHLLVTL